MVRYSMGLALTFMILAAVSLLMDGSVYVYQHASGS